MRDPNILQSFLWEPQKGTPRVLRNPHLAGAGPSSPENKVEAICYTQTLRRSSLITVYGGYRVYIRPYSGKKMETTIMGW